MLIVDAECQTVILGPRLFYVPPGPPSCLLVPAVTQTFPFSRSSFSLGAQHDGEEHLEDWTTGTDSSLSLGTANPKEPCDLGDLVLFGSRPPVVTLGEVRNQWQHSPAIHLTVPSSSPLP